jgi:hypothetical protein
MCRTDWTGCNLEPKKPPKYRKKRTEKTINTGWTQSKTKNLILSFLLSRRLRVRIPPRSQKTPEKQGFFDGKLNEPNLRYTKSMPITITHFGQIGQCAWAKYALFGWNGRRNKGLIGQSSSPKAAGYIKRVSCNGST